MNFSKMIYRSIIYLKLTKHFFKLFSTMIDKKTNNVVDKSIKQLKFASISRIKERC